jgi:hypothetical protein
VGRGATEDHELSAVSEGIIRNPRDGYWICEQVNNPLNDLNDTCLGRSDHKDKDALSNLGRNEFTPVEQHQSASERGTANPITIF